ncbi:MAG: hypothetical protein BGO31_19325 [Bacteroidetes bacterium 43-16]|nr:MAG: hypothetical protein BGO31_19325 [Bacteroidetes bacterium 43-16]
MRKGVSSVRGNARPQIDQQNYYEVASFYPGTVVKSDNDIKWKLFAEEGNGRWRELRGEVKTGRRVPFSFPQKWLGKRLLVEAYLNNAEIKSPPGLIVSPMQGTPQLVKVELLARNGQPFTSRPKYGHSGMVKLHTANLVNANVEVSIWERDTISDTGHDRSSNTLIHAFGAKKISQNNGILELPFVFDNTTWRAKAKAGTFEGAEHEYYAVARIQGSEKISNTVIVLDQFDPGTQPAPAGNGRSTSTVATPEAPTPHEPGKCPRCTVLSNDEVNKIFTSASAADKANLIAAFNEANKKFEIDTCLRKAHFFAQVLAEVGPSLKLNEPEGFNYSVRRLKGADYVAGSNWVNGRTNPLEGGYYATGRPENLKSSPFSYFKNNPRQAELYGRKDLNAYNDKGLQAANSQEIANLVYADENRGPRYKLGNVNPGDGWKFMGKGIIQVTGRSNYTEINKRLERKGYNFDIVNNPDNVLKHKESVLSAMAFWYWKDLQLKSTGGEEVVDSITKIVNEATSTYALRKSNFTKVYEIFQVSKCSPVATAPVQPSNGKWRFPIDNPMLCLYSQNGGAKPWHGSFGENIRDGSANHSGSDLLAKPGTPVYACLDGVVERVYTSTTLAGRVVVVKVTDKETFKSMKRAYTPLYAHKGELVDKGFNAEGDIFLVFMHLSQFGEFEAGKPVKHNDVIGYTGVSGRSGNNFETRNPHLHFEVNNVGSAGGLQGKCNPMVYFNFKTENEMTAADKQLQLEYKNQVWK